MNLVNLVVISPASVCISGLLCVVQILESCLFQCKVMPCHCGSETCDNSMQEGSEKKIVLTCVCVQIGAVVGWVKARISLLIPIYWDFLENCFRKHILL